MNKNRFSLTLRFFFPAIIAATILFAFAAPSRAAVVQEGNVRAALQQTFDHLRAGRYDDLYNDLSASTRSRLARERFTGELRRTRDMYELDRMEIGAVRIAGDFAAADTTLYGRVRRPFDGDGRIVARQYLVREGGQWRIVTDDRARVRQLLARNPQIARRFPYREPRAAVLRDGRWVDLGSLSALRRMAR